VLTTGTALASEESERAADGSAVGDGTEIDDERTAGDRGRRRRWRTGKLRRGEGVGQHGAGGVPGRCGDGERVGDRAVLIDLAGPVKVRADRRPTRAPASNSPCGQS